MKKSPLGEFRSIHYRPRDANGCDHTENLEGGLIIGANDGSVVVTVLDRASRHRWHAGLVEDHGKYSTLAA